MKLGHRSTLLAVMGAGLVLWASYEIAKGPVVMSYVPSANSRNAVASLRYIVEVENMFRTSDADGNGVNDFWTGDIAGLWYLAKKGEPLRMIEYSVCQADAQPCPELGWSASPPHVSTPKAGYWFKALPVEGSIEGRHPNRFTVAAYPANYGSAGTFTYIVDETGIVWRHDLGGRMIKAWPRDPAAEGWSKQN